MASRAEKGTISRVTHMEKALTRRDDGTLGIAEILNTLTAGGLTVLEWRVIRTGEDTFTLVAKLGERAAKKAGAEAG